MDGYESAIASKEQAFGNAAHTALEAILARKPVDWAALELPDNEKAKLKVLLDGWQENVELPEVQAIELPFECEPVKGIFDAVQLTADEVIIWEHKTTKSDLDSDWYWDKLRTDWQVALYGYAATKLYSRPTRIVYNVLRVPQLRLKRGESEQELLERIRADIKESPSRYYRQATIRLSDSSLARVEQDLAEASRQIDAAKAASLYPRSRKCFEFMRRCEWYQKCFEGAELSDERLYRVRTRRP